ncbi:MAG: hypothetical protein AAFR63_16465, partial [Cyanobacteria bacterium J06631_6]
READLNHRPSGYEPDELPDCSIPRRLNKDSTVGSAKAISQKFLKIVQNLALFLQLLRINSR